MPKQTRNIPKLHTRAAFIPASLNEEDRTVELTWSTGSQVRRVDWWTEKEWIEELSLDEEHVNLDRLNAGAPLLPNHRNYSLDDVIGVVEKAWVENGTGHALVRFSDREDVEEIFKEVKSGILRNISVGYNVNKFEKLEEKQNDLSVYRAVDWEPMEISLVTIPADSGAQVRSEDVNHSVEIINDEVNQMTDKVETKQTEKRAAEKPAESVKPDTVDVDKIRVDAAKQERERVASIRKFGATSRVDEKTIDDLIERGVSVTDAKEIMLENWSKQVDEESTRSDSSVTKDESDKFIEAGVNAILGRSGVEKMDGANQMRGMRLTEIAKLCLQRSGVSSTGIDEHTMIKRAFNMDRSITQSTSDFPVLLENAMHKSMQVAYALASDTWSRFCATGSVTDFRAHNRYRLGSFGNLDSLNENGEFKNKSIPDGEKGVITASTKGNLINITRQTIINDDLSAFIALAQMLARAAGRTVEADVYALLASNPVMQDGIALFHASHNNLIASASAVSVASIEKMRVGMAKQTDVSGEDFLDLRPAIWVGGMGNGGEARVVNDAQYDDDSSKNQNKPNKVRGLFSDVVDSPRVTGSEWYMFADPGDAPVIEVAFLNGEQEPFLDSMESFNVDGLQWKVRHDYGVAALDFRGAQKNPGV